MHLNAPLAITLLLGAVVHAAPAPAPQDSAATTSVASEVTTTTLPDGATTTLPVAASTDTAVASGQLDDLAAFALTLANSSVAASSKQKRGGCTLANLSIRREWGTLSSAEREAYTSAVNCLLAKNANTPSSLIPGAKSRFDDFVGTHINQTMTIHYTGTFLAWHRYFTWSYEQALRNECGYTGTQPYWNWAQTAQTGLETSPIFDGSATSMSGNGAQVSGEGDVVLGGGGGLPEIDLPPGTGGGCVTSGPFKNMSVNLGPVSLGLTNGSTISNGDGLTYNPRCLKRDLTTAINQRYANATSVVHQILKPQEIYDFQMTMQGYPGSGDIGVHGGGHYSIGGDPGRDLFVSPGDPVFYLHHAMIDRTWWIWQLLDLKDRTGAAGISGTGTFLNSPPSPNTTMDTPIDLGYATSPIYANPTYKMSDLLSTTSGPFCYIYL
ncbi:Di-copper centre-containing protein [Lepidopterella palustris CBS 459.81]|uniref:Di-copper centre-containing protein n=1 Tax=Lepidopterella palustris CBS 459.81 TaxID=1314670 RepID=A0A8E2J837_9PEZI|nr:Di-copper centre-containing protein [Lepidopterella palustris CBS 459.81]